MMHERSALIVKTPELAGDEFAVAVEEFTIRTSRQSRRRLVLIEGLALWVGCAINCGVMHVVQFKIGVSGHHNDTIVLSQARKGQFIVVLLRLASAYKKNVLTGK
jgi:hypothetical protein